ncbi:hypothetical protein EXIGLDRAFT_765091 [Exidia glandulosa HHB12029]|uniref:F-box domain-containing protein n=1 Tax=Exidia glandulosa HHB12029 TaxID=1314781 RepID=A0A165KQT0_EXIGL|nr:hypothetical protein EXIGLDRAFT_765091 [Exidia glandulosa HHB12029]
MSSYRLPDNLHDELAQHVRSVFSDAREILTEHGTKAFSATDSLRLDSAVRACVDGALLELHQLENDQLENDAGVLVEQRHQQNLERMRRVGFPNEIWLRIWEILSMDSLLSVSHTCRPWRSLALRSSVLWATLDVVIDKRSENCHCGTRRAFDEQLSCRSCGVDIPYGRNNITLMRNLLPRSNAHPLSLSLAIRDVSPQMLELIVQLIRPHAERIAQLRLESFDVAPGKLLSSFDALPILRSLSGGRPVLLSRNIQLPKLQEIKVYSSMYAENYNAIGGLPSFPSVTTLDFAAFEVADFASTLTALPNLDTLCLGRFDRFVPLGNALCDQVRVLAARIRHVRMREVDEDRQHLIELFYNPGRLEFTIDYASHYSDEVYGFSTFAALGEGIELRIGFQRRSYQWGPVSVADVTLEGVDSHGRHRRIRYSTKSSAPSIWDHLKLQFLSSLYIDAVAMPYIWSTDSELELPALRKLTVHIPNEPAPDFILCAPSAILPRCPSLRTLRLTSTSRVSLSAEDVASFIRALHVDGHALDELVQDGIFLQGDLTDLTALVREGVSG